MLLRNYIFLIYHSKDLTVSIDVTRFVRITFDLIIVALLILFVCLFFKPQKINKETKADVKVITLFKKQNNFNDFKLVKLLKESNVKYPDIVYAKSCLESGNFKSDIFLNNNNLFGMRLAKSRPTTAIGSKDGYAIYERWEDSVFDYIIYQSFVLRRVNNKNEYFNALTLSYATDSNYVNKLKQIINEKWKN